MRKKNNILVSVIIPAYNEEKYLGKCLDSLNKQTFTNFETILVDDGSTDRTKLIASEYLVKIWSISHGGAGQARNFGIEKARGKIIVFLDADMIFERNFLKNLTKPIIEGKCIGTYSQSEFINNLNNIWSKCWNINNDIYDNHRMNVNNLFSKLVFRAILKDKFLESGGFNPHLGYMDDHSLYKYGISPLAVKNAIFYHRNPETLGEIFYSSRWIGRSSIFILNSKNIIRYSIFNSFRLSYRKILKGAPLHFLIFKIVFDLGILTGIIFKSKKNNFAK